MEAPSNYTPLSMRDLDDVDISGGRHEHQHDLQNPTGITNYAQDPAGITEVPSVPSLEISPPPSPPIRARTEDSFLSAVSQPLSRKDFLISVYFDADQEWSFQHSTCGFVASSDVPFREATALVLDRPKGSGTRVLYSFTPQLVGEKDTRPKHSKTV